MFVAPTQWFGGTASFFKVPSTLDLENNNVISWTTQEHRIQDIVVSPLALHSLFSMARHAPNVVSDWNVLAETSNSGSIICVSNNSVTMLSLMLDFDTLPSKQQNLGCEYADSLSLTKTDLEQADALYALRIDRLCLWQRFWANMALWYTVFSHHPKKTEPFKFCLLHLGGDVEHKISVLTPIVSDYIQNRSVTASLYLCIIMERWHVFTKQLNQWSIRTGVSGERTTFVPHYNGTNRSRPFLKSKQLLSPDIENIVEAYVSVCRRITCLANFGKWVRKEKKAVHYTPFKFICQLLVNWMIEPDNNVSESTMTWVYKAVDVSSIYFKALLKCCIFEI